MIDYFMYANFQHDEDPIYLFDPTFARRAPELIEDYTVPFYFQEDLFNGLSKAERPFFRFFYFFIFLFFYFLFFFVFLISYFLFII